MSDYRCIGCGDYHMASKDYCQNCLDAIVRVKRQEREKGKKSMKEAKTNDKLS